MQRRHRTAILELPGPPKEPKIMDQYPKIESIGSIGSILLGSFGGPGTNFESGLQVGRGLV